MSRPKRFRMIEAEPPVSYFKPRGVSDPKEVVLTIEEYEALRLKDFNKESQTQCAFKMGLSQPTFHRLLNSARKKISSALVEGKALKIEGGDFIRKTLK